MFGVSLKAVGTWWAKWQAGGRRRWSCVRVASRSGAPGARGGRAGRGAAGGTRSPAL
nr:hypothetical protein [Streptomyces sp. ADI96-02]